MYMYIRARFHWWPASYQVFPSTNGPTAPAAGTRVGNRVNVPDARPRCETTFTLRSSVPRVLFRAPLLQNVAPTLSSVYIRILILPKIIHHSKKPMGSTLIERIEFERICCNIFEKTLVEGLFNWLLQRLFSNGSTVSRKILKPIRRLNCGGNSW